jgi:N-acetylglucosamine kinase-like BadF-type ATPase
VKRPALLAVDGGGSKVDAALLARDGSVVAATRVPNVDGDDDPFGYLDGVAAGVAEVARGAGLDPERRPIAPLGVYCLAGADLPADDRRIVRWLSKQGFSTEDVLRNDTFAVLRAGTERTWGVGIVCGFGTNCSGVAPDGRMYRLPAVGPISGDWGGAIDVGGSALWHALRAEDGRGARTDLRRLVPEYFGLTRPRQVMEAIYFGRLAEERLAELAPVVFGAAAGGDAVARQIVERQADEVVTMATAAIRRLRMSRLDPDVVLGGGIFRNRVAGFFDRIQDGVHRACPGARVTVLMAPPVVGAAMLGLDRIGASKVAHARARAALTHRRLTRNARAGAGKE